MSYFAWQDESKKPIADKLAAAIAAFEQRYGHTPTAILMNEAERAETALEGFAGAAVGIDSGVRRNIYYLSVGGA